MTGLTERLHTAATSASTHSPPRLSSRLDAVTMLGVRGPAEYDTITPHNRRDVMIPGKIVRFLQERANVGHAGTRDRDLVPHGHRISGWSVGDDGRTLTALIPEQFTPHLLDSLQDNGQFSVTIEEFPAHECYQFKGRYVRHRQVEADDLENVERIRERFASSVRPVFPQLTEPIAKAFLISPLVAVECEVLEVYLQTPGPGAGTRLSPPVEA